MKKALIAFAVAFFMSMIFSFLSLVTRASLSFNLANNNDPTGYYVINNVLTLVEIVVPFAAFYVLGYFKMISIQKSTVIAMLVGSILGLASLYLLGIIGYNSANLVLYLNIIGGALIFGVSQYFFPALSGLMLASFRGKKESDNLIVENEGQSVV